VEDGATASAGGERSKSLRTRKSRKRGARGTCRSGVRRSGQKKPNSKRRDRSADAVKVGKRHGIPGETSATRSWNILQPKSSAEIFRRRRRICLSDCLHRVCSIVAGNAVCVSQPAGRAVPGPKNFSDENVIPNCNAGLFVAAASRCPALEGDHDDDRRGGARQPFHSRPKNMGPFTGQSGVARRPRSASLRISSASTPTAAASTDQQLPAGAAKVSFARIMNLVKTAVQECKKRGMKVWIETDCGYPDGFAGGMISRDYPHWACRALSPMRIAPLRPARRSIFRCPLIPWGPGLSQPEGTAADATAGRASRCRCRTKRLPTIRRPEAVAAN